MLFRWTMKELAEIGDIAFARAILAEKKSKLDPCSPLSQKLARAISTLEQVEKENKNPCIKVEVPLGTLVATPSTDSNHPGISIDLRCMGAEMAVGLVECPLDTKTLTTHVWGDGRAEGPTHNIAHEGVKEFFALDEPPVTREKSKLSYSLTITSVQRGQVQPEPSHYQDVNALINKLVDTFVPERATKEHSSKWTNAINNIVLLKPGQGYIINDPSMTGGDAVRVECEHGND